MTNKENSKRQTKRNSCSKKSTAVENSCCSANQKSNSCKKTNETK